VSYTDHGDGSGGQDITYETPAAQPPPRKRPDLVTMLMLGLAVALSAAALAVSLLHAGPRGMPGQAGQPGPAGEQGPAGPAGPAAPTLGYVCQQLFPNGSSSGTETTFYWPCSNNSLNG
jgi:hypothetical protein